MELNQQETYEIDADVCPLEIYLCPSQADVALRSEHIESITHGLCDASAPAFRILRYGLFVFQICIAHEIQLSLQVLAVLS